MFVQTKIFIFDKEITYLEENRIIKFFCSFFKIKTE